MEHFPNFVPEVPVQQPFWLKMATYSSRAMFLRLPKVLN
jgi:hypothetical protein